MTVSPDHRSIGVKRTRLVFVLVPCTGVRVLAARVVASAIGAASLFVVCGVRHKILHVFRLIESGVQAAVSVNF
jgi:hypothetical protein